MKWLASLGDNSSLSGEKRLGIIEADSILDASFIASFKFQILPEYIKIEFIEASGTEHANVLLKKLSRR
jgi:hypothetical protein